MQAIKKKRILLTLCTAVGRRRQENFDTHRLNTHMKKKNQKKSARLLLTTLEQRSLNFNAATRKCSDNHITHASRHQHKTIKIKTSKFVFSKCLFNIINHRLR